MPANLTTVQVVNAALEQVAAQTTITDINDITSPAARAAKVVYAPTVEFLLRDLEPDFARFNATLTPYGGTPPARWPYWYLLPADCMRVLQVLPVIAVLATLDPNDPKPILFDVATAADGTLPTMASVILCDQGPGALINYISSTPTEAQWDAAFTDAVIRRLANPLAMALSGRPDFARELLEQAGASGQMARSVDDSMIRGQ